MLPSAFWLPDVQFYGGAQMENFAPVVARLAGK